MFLSHQYPTDRWAVVWLLVMETVGQVGAGAELPIPSHPTPVQCQTSSGCGSAAAVMVISQPALLP